MAMTYFDHKMHQKPMESLCPLHQVTRTPRWDLAGQLWPVWLSEGQPLSAGKVML